MLGSSASGMDVVIASGLARDVLPRLASGERVGTYFPATSTKMESRKRWMLSGLSTKGKLVVDSGAVQALRKQKRSLLAAGIREVGGRFERGDIVNIFDTDGVRLGCGITNYSAEDITVIKGVHSREIESMLGCEYGSEIVHRNNLVVL